MVLVQFLTQYILMLVTPKSILNYAVYHYLVSLLLALTWYPWLQRQSMAVLAEYIELCVEI